MKKSTKKKIYFILGTVTGIVLYLSVIAAFWYGICWGFDLQYSWKAVFGIVFIVSLMKFLYKAS